MCSLRSLNGSCIGSVCMCVHMHGFFPPLATVLCAVGMMRARGLDMLQLSWAATSAGMYTSLPVLVVDMKTVAC